jgi:DNA-binding NarL/FixJ family response regulator
MNMPVMDGIGVLERLEEGKPYTLMLSPYESPKLIRKALGAGADGYLLKSAKLEDLHLAVKTMLKGETFISEGAQLNKPRTRRARNGSGDKYAAVDAFLKKYSLTKRELEILELITQALSNKEIGKTLFISDQTVSVHRKNIMRKLGVSNTAGLIKTAYDHSLV